MLIYDHKPTTARRDPHIWPKRPGIDYPAIAEAAIERCLDLMATCSRLEADLEEIERRLVAGDRWFLDKTPKHPRYRNGIRTLGRHLDRRIAARASYETASLDLWHECCRLYAAIAHMEPLWAEHFVSPLGIGVPEHPRTVWDVLTGGREPPGHWPPEDRDYWIEGGTTWLPERRSA